MQASLGQHDQYQTRTVILIEPVSMGNETARTGSRSTGGSVKAAGLGDGATLLAVRIPAVALGDQRPGAGSGLKLVAHWSLQRVSPVAMTLALQAASSTNRSASLSVPTMSPQW